MMINQNDQYTQLTKDQFFMVNQWGKEIRKIGQTRMRAIELIRQTILLTYPSEGKFWKSVQEFGKNILKADDDKSSQDSHQENEDERALNNGTHLFARTKVVPEFTRRYLVKTMLLVMREFSFCSTANLKCLNILFSIM